jgi:hypothetical protein
MGLTNSVLAHAFHCTGCNRLQLVRAVAAGKPPTPMECLCGQPAYEWTALVELPLSGL